MLARLRGDRAIADAMSHFGHRGRVHLSSPGGCQRTESQPQLRAAVERVAAGRVTIEENSPFLPTLPLHIGRREQSRQNMPGERRKVPTLLRNVKLMPAYGGPGFYLRCSRIPRDRPHPVGRGHLCVDVWHDVRGLRPGLGLAALGLLSCRGVIPPIGLSGGGGRILMACGLSASIFGLLYGSFFGLEDVVRLVAQADA